MPSRPDLFDDEDGPGTTRDPEPPPTRDSSTTTAPATAGGRRSPNYLVRRAIVVGGVVAVLATASIVIGQLIGSGSSDTTAGGVGPEWNRIVLVDDRTGRIVVDDEQGEELARLESGVRNPTGSAAVGSTLLVTGADRVAVVDIGSEEVDEFEIGADAVVRPSGTALTLLAPAPDARRAVLAHGPSGDVIDTDAFAAVVGARYEFGDARASPSGRDVLVTDSGNFQSVLVSFDRDEPSFFPGLALAVDDELVVTAQNVGNDATINVFDHAGEPVGTGRTASVRAGMITDAGVVLVTVDGAVVVMSPTSGDTTDGDQLAIGTVESGSVTPGGDRLVVTGATGTAIVDGDGSAVTTIDAQRPAGGATQLGSTCITTITPDVAEPQLTVVDVTEGSVLVEANGTEPLLADASGCVVATTSATGYDLMSAEAGVRSFRTGDSPVALSLDGAAIAVVREGRLALVDTAPASDAEESPEPIDLGPRGRTVHFTST